MTYFTEVCYNDVEVRFSTSQQQVFKERFLWKYNYGEVFYVHMSLQSGN